MKTDRLTLITPAARHGASLAKLLRLVAAHRLTVRTSEGRLHVTTDPPEAVKALLAEHGRTLYRVLNRWGDGFGLAMLHVLHDLPPAPFELHPGVTVVDAGRFRASLLRDAMQGPKGSRGAGVERDVRALLLRQFADIMEARDAA